MTNLLKILVFPIIVVGSGMSLVYFLVTEVLFECVRSSSYDHPAVVSLAFGGFQVNLFIYFLMTGHLCWAWICLLGPTLLVTLIVLLLLGME